MAYTITNITTGNEFTFASQETYKAAEDWLLSTNRGEMQDFCKSYGLDLHISPIELRADWHDAAMELYARVHRQ